MGSETKAPGYGHGGLTHSGRFAITDRRNHRTAFASLLDFLSVINSRFDKEHAMRADDCKRKTQEHSVTRRKFLQTVVAGGAVVSAAPAVLRGRNLNEKLNIVQRTLDTLCGDEADTPPGD